MSESISPELNYSPVVNNHSTVIFRKVSPQGASSVTLSATSSVGPTEIIIAPSVFNPSKSRLNFTLSIGAPTVSNYNWVNANALSTISRFVVYDSATNALLCDISNFSQYASLVTPSGTSFSDFATKSVTMNSVALPAATTTNGVYEDIYKSNDLTNPIFSGVGAIGGLSNPTGPNSYFSRQQVGVGAITSAVVVDYSIPLSSVKHSFLSLDRNCYVPSNLVAQIYFSATDSFSWQNASNTNPAAATVASVASATISNIALQLANEGNLAIVSQVINKVMTSGINIPIAYPTTTRQAVSGTTAPSYQLQLTKGYGQRILALLTAPFSSGAINTTNEHARGVVTYYNTFLNNVALKYPNGFDATKSEDYIYGNREYLKNSTIQTSGEYIFAEWLHCDSFFGEKPLHLLDQTQIDGLDVGTQSSTWSIQATQSATTAYNWITVILGQKMLSLTSSGVMIQ